MLGLEAFVVHASEKWALDARTAQAYYFACDIAGDVGLLDLKEYLLLRAAFFD
eukprot:CAMPEP_0119397188 /NCGR_PEP_ID=MMETSP1334-20130426/139897_1 /TAXON_ID=127549 /ORGANISM="Calcidiscus leptoporus, Strain RCC1130" /LENGTH=52 /DNA_ID=CAMNT_0007421001 /DNA_START=1 /DNA_END=156 /DNA_ORIENTATION=-